MVASDLAAFSFPAASSGGTAAVAKAAAAGLGLAVPGGIVLGALSERLALRSVSPLLPLPSASKPTAQKAWGTAVRAATGAVAVRGLYLWSGMSAVDAAASAAALGSASASSNAGTSAVAKLGADALTAVLTFIVWTVCLATGAKIGSVLQPIGITGGIACGKSTVSELLAAKDSSESAGKDDGNDRTPFAIIDVDKIGHDILIPGKLIPSESAYNNVVNAFGTDILFTDAPTTDMTKSDGGDQTSHRIERRKLGDVIFRDPSKRKILNKLTHPLISKIMIKRVVTWNLFRRANDTKNKMVAVDIPLLFEVGFMMKILFGLKVVVACKPSTQLKRLMTRNADLSEEQCQNRIDSQMPVADKVKMADVVIWNDGDMDGLKAEVEKARDDICARVGGWGVSLSKVVLVLGASAVAKTVAIASGI